MGITPEFVNISFVFQSETILFFYKVQDVRICEHFNTIN